jgi:hypothetical protein
MLILYTDFRASAFLRWRRSLPASGLIVPATDCPRNCLSHEGAMMIGLMSVVRERTREYAAILFFVLVLAGLTTLTVTRAFPQDAKPPEFQWQPVDLNEDMPIRGIKYVPESAGQDWSISRAVNTTADVLRFEVREGDHWAEDSSSDGNKERSELDGYRQRWKDDDNIWGAYSFFIEPGRPYRSSWTGISQLHGDKVLPFHVHFENEALAIFTEYQAPGSRPSSTSQYAGKILRAKWHNVVFHVRQGPPGQGRLEFWLDGKKLVDFSGGIGATGNQIYWKYGIYRGYGPIATTFAVQFANMEIGTTDLAARIVNPVAIE